MTVAFLLMPEWMDYRLLQHLWETLFLVEESPKKLVILDSSLLSGTVNKTAVFYWTDHYRYEWRSCHARLKQLLKLSQIKMPKFNSLSTKFQFRAQLGLK